MVAVCGTGLVPSVPSSFVSIDWFRIVRGDNSQAATKRGCCLYVVDLLSFIQIDVNLLNVALELLFNWMCTDLQIHFSRMKV